MISWWGRYSYLNNEPIKIIDVVLMNDAYGLSGLFESIVRSKSIAHNKHTGRRINFCSKPTPIHGPVHKSDLNYLYSMSHFSWLPQGVGKVLINRLYQKVSYDYIIIDPVNNGLVPLKYKAIFTYVSLKYHFGYKRIMFRFSKHVSC